MTFCKRILRGGDKALCVPPLAFATMSEHFKSWQETALGCIYCFGIFPALPYQRGPILYFLRFRKLHGWHFHPKKEMFVIYRHPPAKATHRASLGFGVGALIAFPKCSVCIGACTACCCQPPPPILSIAKISRICHKGLPAVSAPSALG